MFFWKHENETLYREKKSYGMIISNRVVLYERK